MITMNKPLYKYNNGNYIVKIYNDGTKERYTKEKNIKLKPEFPESIDLKITDKCNKGCLFCHEGSNPTGEHGDLKNVIQNLKPLPAGIEIAIGGGNPLDHPDLIEFLRVCKWMGFVCNITINAWHLTTHTPYIELTKQIIDEKLVHGVGLSINKPNDYRDMVSDPHYFEWLINNPNVVVHCINGITRIQEIEEMAKTFHKFLILGYKEFGNGINPLGSVQIIKDEMESKLWKLMSNKNIHVLSFDNLAIDQLNVEVHVSYTDWKKLYMGNEGQFTMYYDAVKEQYAESSTSKLNNRKNCYEYDNIVSYFQKTKFLNIKNGDDENPIYQKTKFQNIKNGDDENPIYQITNKNKITVYVYKGNIFESLAACEEYVYKHYKLDINTIPMILVDGHANAHWL